MLCNKCIIITQIVIALKLHSVTLYFIASLLKRNYTRLQLSSNINHVFLGFVACNYPYLVITIVNACNVCNKDTVK